jgi:hypothetical protein
MGISFAHLPSIHAYFTTPVPKSQKSERCIRKEETFLAIHFCADFN